MLQKLLDRISQGGSFSTKSLAQELGASPELVEAMLASLAQAGYLRQAEGCAAGACGQCQPGGACPPRQKIWVLVKRETRQD